MPTSRRMRALRVQDYSPHYKAREARGNHKAQTRKATRKRERQARKRTRRQG